jgi:hypothetical protein
MRGAIVRRNYYQHPAALGLDRALDETAEIFKLFQVCVSTLPLKFRPERNPPESPLFSAAVPVIHYFDCEQPR